MRIKRQDITMSHSEMDPNIIGIEYVIKELQAVHINYEMSESLTLTNNIKNLQHFSAKTRKSQNVRIFSTSEHTGHILHK